MAILNGKVIGILSGKLGNLATRTVNGQTILAARPSSFNASPDPAVIENRKRFSVTAKFASAVLVLNTLSAIWRKVKNTTSSVFNEIFQNNYGFSTSEKPTVKNILAPDGFPLNITKAEVDTNRITAELPVLNTASVFREDKINLSANALVCYYDPTNPADDPFKIISLSKEIANFNFTLVCNLQMDYNVFQVAAAAKYQHNILYLCVVSKNAEGKVVQNSSTFTKLT